jgi:Flp pilus assembly protein TadG
VALALIALSFLIFDIGEGVHQKSKLVAQCDAGSWMNRECQELLKDDPEIRLHYPRRFRLKACEYRGNCE